jgi:hypothetical protein
MPKPKVYNLKVYSNYTPIWLFLENGGLEEWLKWLTAYRYLRDDIEAAVVFTLHFI